MEKIRLGPMCEKTALKKLCGGDDDVLYFSKSQLLSAGLSLGGFKTDLKGRAVLIGEQETEYINCLPEEERLKRIELLKDAEIVIITDKSLEDEVRDVFLRLGIKAALSLKPASLTADLMMYIEGKLNTVEIVHGVLLDVFGVGTMIIGESGVGKSEIALDLITRGHLLVADDAVAARREGNAIIGCSPSIIRHLMEIRGIGIIDVRAMYGAGAVKIEQEIEMVVRLSPYSDIKDYMAEESFELSGVSIPLIDLPLREGRNITVLIEAAARHLRLKYMGYDAMGELNRRMKKSREEDSEKKSD